ncbi:MAG: hypothetical protein GY719_37495 [bacterium]|nr:hypothetical protein [bacterium]
MSGSRTVWRHPVLVLTAAVTLALWPVPGAAQDGVEPGDLSDEFRQELEASGRHSELLETWTVNEGQTVSLIWRFNTPQQTDIPPDFEIPAVGEYPWYTGSSVDVVDRAAYWTGSGWGSGEGAFGADGDADGGDPFMTASDTNPPQEEAVKKVTLAFWWKPLTAGSVPTNWGFTSPGGTTWANITVNSWPSYLYPGYTFEIMTGQYGPPCPASVTGSVNKRGKIEIKALVVHGHCEGN